MPLSGTQINHEAQVRASTSSALDQHNPEVEVRAHYDHLSNHAFGIGAVNVFDEDTRAESCRQLVPTMLLRVAHSGLMNQFFDAPL